VWGEILLKRREKGRSKGGEEEMESLTTGSRGLKFRTKCDLGSLQRKGGEDGRGIGGGNMRKIIGSEKSRALMGEGDKKCFHSTFTSIQTVKPKRKKEREMGERGKGRGEPRE